MLKEVRRAAGQRFSLAAAKREAAQVGCTLTLTDSEYRVNLVGCSELTAYYTNDLNDAVGTARAFAAGRAAATDDSHITGGKEAGVEQ